MTNTMRGRFEAWASSKVFGFGDCLSRMPSDDYVDIRARAAWEAWQAAHADMLPVLERVREALCSCKSVKIFVGEQLADNEQFFDERMVETTLTELEAIMKGEEV